MRRLFLYAVVGLLLGAGLVALIEQDPGYIFVSWRDTTIETSLWFGLLLALLLWLVLAVLLRFVGNVLRSRLRFMDWLGNRKSRNATALSNRGLINFVEGNWEQSRKQLLRARLRRRCHGSCAGCFGFQRRVGWRVRCLRSLVNRPESLKVESENTLPDVDQ